MNFDAIKPIDEVAIRVARNMAARFDAVVDTLLRERIGDYVLHDLQHRLQAVQYLGRPETVYMLDGKLFATFWPAEMEWVGNTITYTQKYQAHLWPGEEGFT
jgi:hypothetical protein